MITLKDYAKETGVTYEAVRQRVKRYEKELEGHIHRQGRTQYLDDVAVAFLNEHRLQEPTVLYTKGAGEDYRQTKEQLAQLDEENRELLRELREVNGKLRVLQQFKLEAEATWRRIEESKEEQERRERELNEREERMALEISEAAQKAAEDARRAAEEEKAAEVARIQQEADKQLVAAEKAHQKVKEQLGEKDRRIQELENRTLVDYLKGLFLQKGKE